MAKLGRAVAECGKHLEVEYFGLQDVFTRQMMVNGTLSPITQINVMSVTVGHA